MTALRFGTANARGETEQGGFSQTQLQSSRRTSDEGLHV